MQKKRGRPNKINSRRNLHVTRMTDEEDYVFRKLCEKSGYSESECLRKGMEALDYLLKNDMIYCITKNTEDDYLNYCYTENEDDFEDDL